MFRVSIGRDFDIRYRSSLVQTIPRMSFVRKSTALVGAQSYANVPPIAITEAQAPGMCTLCAGKSGAKIVEPRNLLRTIAPCSSCNAKTIILIIFPDLRSHGYLVSVSENPFLHITEKKARWLCGVEDV